jgi:hypothetical protein
MDIGCRRGFATFTAWPLERLGEEGFLTANDANGPVAAPATELFIQFSGHELSKSIVKPTES